MRQLRLWFLIGLAGVACDSTPDGPGDAADTASDSTSDGAGDAVADPLSDAADTAPDGPADDASDLSSDPAADLSLDALPDTLGGDASQTFPAERADTAVPWSLQSTGSTQLLMTALETGDGALLVTASFDEDVSLGGLTIEADAEPRGHGLVAKVDGQGDVAFLRHLCDGCLGYAGAELPDGGFAFGAAVGTDVVFEPGTASERDLGADAGGGLVYTLDDDGVVRAAARFAESDSLDVRVVAPAPDGGLYVGGHAWAATFADGTTMEVPEGVFYPGRAFLVRLDADLEVVWVDEVRGTAASTFTMLLADETGVTAFGDFGGYPLGVTSEFGAANEPIAIEAVSSDDDPAMDIFLARWSGAEAAFAYRLAHYSNGPRIPTWIVPHEGGVEVLLHGTHIERDGAQYALMPRYGGVPDWLRARFGPDGAYRGGTAYEQEVARGPEADTWLGVTSLWQGQELDVRGLSFQVSEDDAETHYAGVLLGVWNDDGALLRAGLLELEVDASRYVPSLQASTPLADGSALLLLHGSAPVTLRPDAGLPMTLAREGGNGERLIFTRLRLEP